MDATSILVGLLLGAALAAPAGFLLAKSMLASRHAGSDALLEQSRRQAEESRATIERLRSFSEGQTLGDLSWRVLRDQGRP